MLLSSVSSSSTQACLRGTTTETDSSHCQQEDQNMDRDMDVVDDMKPFDQFMSTFHKRYDTRQEFWHRFDVFQSNWNHIQEHNAQPGRNFTLGINAFSDLTPLEFQRHHVRGWMQQQSQPQEDQREPKRVRCESFAGKADHAPVSIDWQRKGAVNPVRDQGQCGSCWAFATTANAESAWFIATGQLLDLSEEWLVDCSTGVNQGCNGGNPDSALTYMIQHGQCSESNYPYTATDGECRADSVCSPDDDNDSANAVYFTQCLDVTPQDQVALKEAVSMTPVVVAIEADTRYFQSYSSGVLDADACGTNLDHAVEIVGYGHDDQTQLDYWLVRNSWGESWGEQGYVKIKRTESTHDAGICGIAMQPSFIRV